MVNWDQLTTTDVKSAWSLCAVDISEKVFSSELVTVPRIEDAPYFDLMVCFSKPHPKSLDKHATEHLSKDSDFCLHGHLSDLTVRDTKLISPAMYPNLHKGKGTNEKELLKASAATIKVDLKDSKPTFHQEDEDKCKSVTIQFHHLEKEVVDWTKLYEGDMVFDLNKLDLEGRRRLYMITEVIFSDGLSISVKANDVEFEDVIPARVPVAFSYTRFPIDKHGIIKPALKTEIDIEATFESPDSVF